MQKCAARESNPGRKNGNLACYHYTSGAFQPWIRKIKRNWKKSVSNCKSFPSQRLGIEGFHFKLWLGWPYRWIGAYSTGQTIPSCPIKKGLECLQQEKLTSRLVLSGLSGFNDDLSILFKDLRAINERVLIWSTSNHKTFFL